ncbi:hypothetical protein G5714_010670 [Onychostoma macrolepis]|uniref:Uncharacterized protein n=1 Tax=Onychostoma macrolepis TaxID=369639 RepID=A0A7J6CL29_9TELE|nr:hypothetical protein G5714_010670 [Onychostoma macrolepis]
MVVWLKRSSLAKPVLKEKQRLLGRSPTLGQILTFLNKLQRHFIVNEEEDSFTKTIKDTIWNDLSKRYKDGNNRQFLEEGTALDPRFKLKVADEVWTRLEDELIRRTS